MRTRVMCISKVDYLTNNKIKIGKIYDMENGSELISGDGNKYSIIYLNESVNGLYFPDKLFITLEDYREQQLLLIFAD